MSGPYKVLMGFGLVGPGGIEPPTSPLSGVRSSHLSYGPRCKDHRVQSAAGATTGGAGRDRTGDLLSANQALSQLSYSPKTQPLPHGRGSEKIIEASWMQGPTRPAREPLQKEHRIPSGDAEAGSLPPP